GDGVHAGLPTYDCLVNCQRRRLAYRRIVLPLAGDDPERSTSRHIEPRGSSRRRGCPYRPPFAIAIGCTVFGFLAWPLAVGRLTRSIRRSGPLISSCRRVTTQCPD